MRIPAYSSMWPDEYRHPPNVSFEVDDVESPWAHDEKFDYVFCRYMTACILDWPKLVGNIYR